MCLLQEAGKQMSSGKASTRIHPWIPVREASSRAVSILPSAPIKQKGCAGVMIPVVSKRLDNSSFHLQAKTCSVRGLGRILIFEILAQSVDFHQSSGQWFRFTLDKGWDMKALHSVRAALCCQKLQASGKAQHKRYRSIPRESMSSGNN